MSHKTLKVCKYKHKSPGQAAGDEGWVGGVGDGYSLTALFTFRYRKIQRDVSSKTETNDSWAANKLNSPDQTQLHPTQHSMPNKAALHKINNGLQIGCELRKECV